MNRKPVVSELDTRGKNRVHLFVIHGVGCMDQIGILGPKAL